MHDDLYFIPIVARALSECDMAGVLEDALGVIKRLGTEPRYERGRAQFVRFMRAVAERTAAIPKDLEASLECVADDLIVELATGAFDHSAEAKAIVCRWLKGNPKRLERYEMLCSDMERDIAAPWVPEVVVEKEGKAVGHVSIPAFPNSASIANVTPGFYRVRLSTGRVLWEGALRAEDLLWSRAFPGQALEFAADTGIRQPRSSHEFDLLEGEAILRVCPGTEAGRIEIRMSCGKEGSHGG